MYAITLAGPALDWLVDCRDVKSKRRIGDTIDRLGQNPRPPGCIKLAGQSDVWRVRVGAHRILYEIHDARLHLLVIRVAKRSEAYR